MSQREQRGREKRDEQVGRSTGPDAPPADWIRSLVRNVPCTLYRYEPRSDRLRFLSDSIEKLTGRGVEYFAHNAYQRHLDLVHPADRERVDAAYREAIKDGRPFEIAYRLCPREGSPRWVRQRGRGVVENGETLCLDGILWEETARREAELALNRRDAILEATGYAVEHLLGRSEGGSLREGLRRLGEACRAQRAYVFENRTDPDGRRRMILRHEWTAADVPAVLDREDPGPHADALRELRWDQARLTRWRDLLERNLLVVGLPSEAPPPLRDYMEQAGLKASMLVPVFVEEAWWGLVGLDIATRPLPWSDPEVEAIRLAVRMLGIGIERLSTEHALKAGEQTISALLNATPDRVVLLTPDGEVLACNDAAAAAFGVSREDFVGQNLLALCPPELADKRRRALGQVAETGWPLHHEDWREGRDLENFLYPIFDTDGAIRQIAVYCRDVTDWKHTTRALRRSQQRYRRLVENTNDIVYELDASARIMHISPHVKRYGFEPAAIIGRSFLDFVAPEDRQAEAEAFRNAIDTGVEKTEVFRCLAADGTAYWFEDRGRVQRDETGRIIGVVGVLRDVTERIERDAELARARRRLQQVIDNTWDILFEIDPKGNYTFANPAAERITGYSLAELLRMNMRDLLAPESVGPVLERLSRRLRGEDLEQPFRIEIIRQDGERRTLELVTTPVTADMGQGGSLTAIQGVARDITDRRRAEREAQAARSELETAREQERRRLAREVHDNLGQQAVSMHLTLGNILAAAEDLPEDMTRRLTTAQQTASRLVRDTRRFSQELYPPTLESLGLVPTLRQLAAEVSCCGQVTMHAPRTLENRRWAQEVEIVLFRIAQEAVTNALKHASLSERAEPAGSRGQDVPGTCEGYPTASQGRGDCEPPLPDLRVDIRLRRRSGGIELSVQDNGPGFAPAESAGPATGRPGMGNGMGMTSMRDRADSIGAELDVRTGPRGTRIRVRVGPEALERATRRDATGGTDTAASNGE